MFVSWLVLSLLAGGAGAYLWKLALPNYREVVHREEKLSFALVAGAATQFAISGALMFFAAYFLTVTAIDRYTAWTSAEVLGVVNTAVGVAFAILFASLYQMWSTRKYRQLMTRQNKK